MMGCKDPNFVQKLLPLLALAIAVISPECTNFVPAKTSAFQSDPWLSNQSSPLAFTHVFKPLSLLSSERLALKAFFSMFAQCFL